MPSTYQAATPSTVTITDLHEAYGEPPGILDRGLPLLRARLRGIDDLDLLREYARVAAEHKGAGETLAAINQRIAAVQAEP